MKKYDIFLFDADGTLFDYDMAEANALKIMFENCGDSLWRYALNQFYSNKNLYSCS